MNLVQLSSLSCIGCSHLGHKASSVPALPCRGCGGLVASMAGGMRGRRPARPNGQLSPPTGGRRRREMLVHFRAAQERHGSGVQTYISFPRCLQFFIIISLCLLLCRSSSISPLFSAPPISSTVAGAHSTLRAM